MQHIRRSHNLNNIFLPNFSLNFIMWCCNNFTHHHHLHHPHHPTRSKPNKVKIIQLLLLLSYYHHTYKTKNDLMNLPHLHLHRWLQILICQNHLPHLFPPNKSTKQRLINQLSIITNKSNTKITSRSIHQFLVVSLSSYLILFFLLQCPSNIRSLILKN